MRCKQPLLVWMLVIERLYHLQTNANGFLVGLKILHGAQPSLGFFFTFQSSTLAAEQVFLSHYSLGCVLHILKWITFGRPDETYRIFLVRTIHRINIFWICRCTAAASYFYLAECYLHKAFVQFCYQVTLNGFCLALYCAYLKIYYCYYKTVNKWFLGLCVCVCVSQTNHMYEHSPQKQFVQQQ